MVKTAVYAGSFDPVTNGHLDVIKRSLKMFDKVIVAVFDNPPKKNVLFSAEERVKMIQESMDDHVTVESFSGLLVNYLKNKDIKFVVRGIRAMSDFDHEFQMAVVNKKMLPDCETIFIATDKRYFYLNSTLVKELALHGGCIEDLVPENVKKKLKEKFTS
ncbi:pantetheine-phosphate adenylyltransferase [Candidatus Aenigmatarchaeota archaeon]